MKKKINSDVVFGIIGILVALFFIVNGMKLPGATKNGVPGSAYFPNIAAAGVIFFSVLVIIEGLKNPKEYFRMDAKMKRNLVQMIEVLAALAVFLVVWRYIPLIPAALAYMFALCLILKQPLKFSIPYTVGVVLALYAIFSIAFRVRLNIN